MCVCVRACVRYCVCVCVREREREGGGGGGGGGRRSSGCIGLRRVPCFEHIYFCERRFIIDHDLPFGHRLNADLSERLTRAKLAVWLALEFAVLF